MQSSSGLLGVSLVLLLALASPALTGCGGGGDDSGSASAGAAGATSAPAVGTVESFAELSSASEGIAMASGGAFPLYAGSAGAVWTIAADGTSTKLADVPGPLGIAVRADGSLLVCGKGEGDQGKGDFPGVVWAVTQSGQKTALVGPGAGMFALPNMVAAHPDGSFVFTDSKANKVYGSSADGAKVTLLAEISYANGVAFSVDKKTLFVASYDQKRIWKLARAEDGTFGPAAVAYENVENVDGITALASGDFVLVRTPEITRLAADGTAKALAPGASIGIPANGALGADGWLYVSNLLGKKVARVYVGEKGAL